jgi:AraC-like DNA-binding protein
MLSKTSYSAEESFSAAAMLVSWGARAVYIGPGFNLPAHRNSVAVLALALMAPMRVAINARDLSQGFRLCRSALIQPNELHLIETSADVYAFIYLDGLSRDLSILRAQCAQPGEKISFGLRNEREVIDLIAAMPRNMMSWSANEANLSSALGFVQARTDPRIASVVNAILARPNDARGAEDWASDLGLSSSRFQHLFKECIGIPFRRYRLWSRMRLALSLSMGGTNLTFAALEAGLSSSAHLSTAFKAMFGISPSQLIGVSPLYIESPMHFPC